MQRLKPDEHLHLTEKVLKSLTQNRISTILDFLQEDVEKLRTITKLSLPQVLDVRNDILRKYSAPLVAGSTILINNAIKKKFISTGIDDLNNLLDGGIPTGYITEVCGLAECGKTQLCLQLAINCVKNTDCSVLYVDTKGDFSAIRIQKILDACGYSHQDMAQIMSKINVCHIWTMDEILDLFKKLKDKKEIVDNLSLIIIDSLPCLMFQHLGENNKVGLTFLNTLVNYSRFLCKEMNIGIVCVNIQTRWVDQDIVDADDDAESTTTTEILEKRNRCLGKYWHLIPAVLIMLEKIKSQIPGDTKVSVTVPKSFKIKCESKCILKINDVGVT